jgi:hypothetical protein
LTRRSGEKPLLPDLPGQRCLKRPLGFEGGRKARRDRQLETSPGLSIFRQYQGSGAANRLFPPLPGNGSGAHAGIHLPFGHQPADFPPGKGGVALHFEPLSREKLPRRPAGEAPVEVDGMGQPGTEEQQVDAGPFQIPFPLAGDGRSRGLCRGEAPLQASPPGKREIDIRVHAAFVSFEAERCPLQADGTPIQGQGTRSAGLPRNDQPSGADVGSRGGKRPLPAPSKLRREDVDVKRLAILFPVDAPPGECDPAREIEPFPGEDFPRDLPREAPVQADIAGQPAAEGCQVEFGPFSRYFHYFRDGQPGGCGRCQCPFQHSPARQVELQTGAHPLVPSVDAERTLLDVETVLLRRHRSQRVDTP